MASPLLPVTCEVSTTPDQAETNPDLASTRRFLNLKLLGDGTFGVKVLLCDWQSPLPPYATYLNTMAGRLENYKRLVALKIIPDRPGRGSPELEIYKALPHHPNIVLLLDHFRGSESQNVVNGELSGVLNTYLVLEAMEGNLIQFIRARRGRSYCPGLTSSMVFQITSGIAHLHSNGYFHRDIKPENILVTTVRIQDYFRETPGSKATDKDVVAVLKLTDLGLAKKIDLNPEQQCTEYVSVRWYRAPEILLRSRHYTSAIDMWALGVVVAEIVNLRPLFPGDGELDMLSRIRAVIGTPHPNEDQDRVDEYGSIYCSGPCEEGISLAMSVGYEFPKTVELRPFRVHFPSQTDPLLVEFIRSLLEYDPAQRPTAVDCLQNTYFHETAYIRETDAESVLKAAQQIINA